jgi:hypothetical protein
VFRLDRSTEGCGVPSRQIAHAAVIQFADSARIPSICRATQTVQDPPRRSDLRHPRRRCSLVLFDLRRNVGIVALGDVVEVAGRHRVQRQALAGYVP